LHVCQFSGSRGRPAVNINTEQLALMQKSGMFYSAQSWSVSRPVDGDSSEVGQQQRDPAWNVIIGRLTTEHEEPKHNETSFCLSPVSVIQLVPNTRKRQGKKVNVKLKSTAMPVRRQFCPPALFRNTRKTHGKTVDTKLKSKATRRMGRHPWAVRSNKNFQNKVHLKLLNVIIANNISQSPVLPPRPPKSLNTAAKIRVSHIYRPATRRVGRTSTDF